MSLCPEVYLLIDPLHKIPQDPEDVVAMTPVESVTSAVTETTELSNGEDITDKPALIQPHRE